jgi:DNA repair protein RadC
MESTNEKSLWNVAEIQLSYKNNVKLSQRPIVRCSKDAYNIFLQSWDKSKIEFVEQFKVMLTNRGQKVLGVLEISTGGVSGTVADPKVIFAAAIKGNACGFILAHNHPSGNLIPSQADIDLTRKMKEGGKILEIQLLDHIIVTSEGYYAFSDDGLI